MAMICPKCGGGFEQRLECPRCDVRLVVREEVSPPDAPMTSAPALPAPAESWQHTPWGRIAIGLVLAQGIFHGLKHFLDAGLMLSMSMEKQELWGSLGGFLAMQLLGIVGVVVGGLLAGAGQRHAAVYGAVLGAWNGILLTFVHPEPPPELNGLNVYGLPLVHAVFASASAWIGSTIWRPLSPAPGRTPARQPLKAALKQRQKFFAGPILWVRVVMGTCFALAGVLSSRGLLDKLVAVSSGNLSPESHHQVEIITLEITGLAIVLGAALAGASSRNGPKQGLAVGLATAVILLGIRLGSPDPPSFLVLAAAMFGPVVLGIIGGGFGGQLLPPLLNRPRRKLDTP